MSWAFYNVLYFAEFLDVFNILQILLVSWILIYTLLTVAIFTVFERKLLAAGQRRLGPHVVGYAGILQPFADAFKLLAKQFLIPTSASRNSFIWAPAIVLVASFSGWLFMPFSAYESLVFTSLSLFFILGLSSIGALGILLTGWSGGSRYSVLGGLRAAAQLISYEIVFGFLFFPLILEAGSANLISIMASQEVWFCFVHPILFLIFLILILAETNRAPFDLPEAESELVAGFNVEYSSAGFTVLFLAEYNSMLLMSALGAVTFLGGFGFYNSPLSFAVKAILFCFFIIAIRGILPRYRYDQLMRISWGPFLMFVTFAVIFASVKVLYFPHFLAQVNNILVDGGFLNFKDPFTELEYNAWLELTRLYNQNSEFRDFLEAALNENLTVVYSHICNPADLTWVEDREAYGIRPQSWVVYDESFTPDTGLRETFAYFSSTLEPRTTYTMEEDWGWKIRSGYISTLVLSGEYDFMAFEGTHNRGERNAYTWRIIRKSDETVMRSGDIIVEYSPPYPADVWERIEKHRDWLIKQLLG